MPIKWSAVNEQRIAEVAADMVNGTFRTGESAKEYAREWGISVARAYKLTAEASKRVKAAITRPDDVTDLLCETLLRVRHEAFELARNPAHAAKSHASRIGT